MKTKNVVRVFCAVMTVLYILALCPFFWARGCEANVESEQVVEIHRVDEIAERKVVRTRASEQVVVEEGEEVEESTYYDVPLDDELQDHIFAVCESYGVDTSVVISMIEKESTFVAECMGDGGNSYGLMQVQPRWHKARMERLGVTDLLDPYQNVLVGVDYLAELIGMEKGLEWALMAYNGGPSNANKAISQVVNYKNSVLEKAENLVMRVGVGE